VKRLLALLVAVGLVGGAVLVRNRIDDSAGGGGSGDTSLRLVCGTDLAAACRAVADADGSIDLTVEDEAVTADRLVAATGTDVGFDAWVAAGPWAEIVADDRAQAGTAGPGLGTPSKVLARSPATIVAQDDRAAALASACAGPVTWACIGRFAGLPWTEAGGSATWGTVKPGLAAPDTGASLVGLSQGVASQLGTTDYARNDFDDPAVSSWFDQLVGAAKRSRVPGQTPLARFLVAPATFGAVGALEAESGPSVARAANRDGLMVIYPEPVSTADVTVTPPAGGKASDVLDRIGADPLLDALAASGWRVPGRPAADGVGGGPSLPRSAGLPAPGVLQFLRGRWEQVP
jgi:hypothetical protein